MSKPHYLTTTEYFALSRACIPIAEAFGGDVGFGVYLVGSCLERPNFRDVDVRAILGDEAFDRLFPDLICTPLLRKSNALWSVICHSISAMLSMQTGLAVDFQIQRQSMANAAHKGPRNALIDHEPTFAGGGDGTTKVGERDLYAADNEGAA